MATMAGMNRASYNRPQITIGQRHTRPARAASPTEAGRIRQAITLLNEASCANTDATFEYKASQAYRILYSLLKERKGS